MRSIRFLHERGPRAEGDVVRFDDASAAAIVAEGAAVYADEPALSGSWEDGSPAYDASDGESAADASDESDDDGDESAPVDP
jgi:hypothetical protein